LEWNAGRKWLDVKMESGVVSVRGPVPGGRVVLRAGQSLSVGVAGDGGSRPALDPTPAEPPILAPLAPARASERRVMPSGPARPRAQVGDATPPSWSHQLDEGRAGAIIADAERRGLERVLRESGSDELSALADAARYIRRPDLARQALRAQMRRFPSSPRARDALFFLGRITEDTGGGSFDALEYYDRYLRDTPDGTYASEALGRKMIILERMNRDADARQIAGDYLRRFPRGTYAHAAQAVARAR
jgi:TolA-binding protein